MELLEERIRRDGVDEVGRRSEGGWLSEPPDGHQPVQRDGQGAQAPVRRRAHQQDPHHRASGIGIAAVVAQHFNVPVVFAKKSQSINLDGDVYSTKIQSFTHQRIYDVIVSKKFLTLTTRAVHRRLPGKRLRLNGSSTWSRTRAPRSRASASPWRRFPARRRRSAQSRLSSGVAGHRAVYEPGNR